MLDLGTILSNARKCHGYSQMYVAKQTGISQANIVKYEKNLVRTPQKRVLKKFADFYHMPLARLLVYAYPDITDRVPKQIYEMLEKPDAIPFLMKAYNEYIEYINNLNSLRSNNK